MEIEIFKIDRKKYIQYLLKVEKMTLYYVTIFFIKAGLFISID